MGWDDQTIHYVYDKTGGYCRYCEKKIARINYGNPYGRATWEIDHSIPLSRGGTDHRNNLFPACVPCNREKGTMTGAEFLRLFENSPTQQPSWWEGPAGTLVGAIAVLLMLNALSNDSQRQ